MTLDADVERLIRNAMKERGLSFKEALNQAARAGLRGERPKRRKKFVQPSFHMGAEQYFRWDKALSVAEAMEDDEIVRKLSLRK